MTPQEAPSAIRIYTKNVAEFFDFVADAQQGSRDCV